MNRIVCICVIKFACMSSALFCMEAQIDKKALVQGIGHFMLSAQGNERIRRADSAEAFKDIASNNTELAHDIYTIYSECICEGRNQEAMTNFCKKWGIKELSAGYKHSDYDN